MTIAEGNILLSLWYGPLAEQHSPQFHQALALERAQEYHREEFYIAREMDKVSKSPMPLLNSLLRHYHAGSFLLNLSNGVYICSH